MPLVLLTDPIHPEATETIAQVAELRVAPARDPETLTDAAREADVVVVRSNLPPALFEHATRLRAAIRHGAGVDMIPIDVASRHGVMVANAPGTNAVSVAEYAVGQMLALSRRLTRIDATLRRDGWHDARTLSSECFDLAGRTLAILGVGAIGTELARICHAGLRMKVIGHRRSTAPMPANVEAVPLDALFARADVLVLSCPLDDSTRGLVSERLLGLMKPTSLLVNVSRGAVVDEPALLKALGEGGIGGAALDVFGQQPLAAGSPLLGLPNVVVSAHMAGLTQDSMRRMGQVVAMQVLQVLAGELPTHLVNHEALDKIRMRLQTLRQT